MCMYVYVCVGRYMYKCKCIHVYVCLLKYSSRALAYLSIGVCSPTRLQYVTFLWYRTDSLFVIYERANVALCVGSAYSRHSHIHTCVCVYVYHHLLPYSLLSFFCCLPMWLLIIRLSVHTYVRPFVVPPPPLIHIHRRVSPPRFHIYHIVTLRVYYVSHVLQYTLNTHT